jgi:hypothetical protein
VIEKDTPIGTLLMGNRIRDFILRYDGDGYYESTFRSTVVYSENRYMPISRRGDSPRDGYSPQTQFVIGESYVSSLDMHVQGLTPIMNKVGIENTGSFPHQCPHCNAPAYVGFNMVDCSLKCKRLT